MLEGAASQAKLSSEFSIYTRAHTQTNCICIFIVFVYVYIYRYVCVDAGYDSGCLKSTAHYAICQFHPCTCQVRGFCRGIPRLLDNHDPSYPKTDTDALWLHCLRYQAATHHRRLRSLPKHIHGTSRPFSATCAQSSPHAIRPQQR